MSDAPELNPCPFCGQTPDKIVDATRHLGCYRIIHRGCVIPNFSLEGKNASDVADRWNRRADLPPTLAQAIAMPEVRKLVEALRPFYAAVFNDNGDVTVSTGHITTRDWLRLETALHRIGETK